MNIVLDTHTLGWLLTENKKIPKKVKDCFRKADIVFIPTIVLTELLYMLKKKRKIGQFTKILIKLRGRKRFSFVSLDFGISEKCLKYAQRLEMHDNIIVVTAEYLDIPLVTKDPQIQKVYKNTIW